MASHRIPIGGFQLVPDSSGTVFFEPYNIKATNDVWRHLICIFEESPSPATVYGVFDVPLNYDSGGSVIPVWSTTATSGNMVWGLDERAVGGDDIESFDQSGTESSATIADVAPSAAHERMESSIVLGATVSGGTTLEFQLSRHTAASAIAAAVQLHNLLFEYEDSA